MILKWRNEIFLLFHFRLSRKIFLIQFSNKNFSRNKRKQEYSVQLTFREQWMDERLKFDDFGGEL
jgi:anionic glutamate receptor